MASSSSIPDQYERQYHGTGVTYHDPELNGLMVGTTAFRGWTPVTSGVLSESRDPERHFSTKLGGWDYDFVASSHADKRVRAHMDHTPISHVGMFSAVLGTRHDGYYLDRLK